MSISSTLVRWTGGWCVSLLVVSALGCGSSTGATGSGGAGGSVATGGLPAARVNRAAAAWRAREAPTRRGAPRRLEARRAARARRAAGTKGTGGTNGAAGGKGAAPSAWSSPPEQRLQRDDLAGQRHGDHDVSGTTRQYILTLPTGYDPHHVYPLLFAFHGGSSGRAVVVDGDPPQSGPYYGIQAVANNAAILVAPQALSGSWTNQGGRDVAYVDAMLSRFESQLCVDQSRIFATGFSFGAIMTIALGCNDSSKFRAIAAMSGEIMNGCPDTRSLPYWSSHGMSDPTINFSLGQAARDTFVQRNHCSSQTVATSPSGCVSYQGCDPGFPVVWCPFDGVHEPPPFAGSAIWAFLSQF